MEFVYLVEGINFAFERCVYRDREIAIDDIRLEYPNSGDMLINMPSDKVGTVTLGNGNVLVITRVRLL